MKTAVAQFKAKLGDIDHNLRRMNNYIEKASAQGCKLIVFPEVADTGYQMEIICQLASSWDSGRELNYLQNSARENAIYVVTGLSERKGTTVHNSAVAINPAGEIIGQYRKMHLYPAAPAYEDRHLEPGSGIAIFKVADLTCGIIICSDLQFPELARLYAISGVQLLLVLSAWCVQDAYHWRTLLAARSIENQIFIAAANRVGTDASVTFCGSSQILDPSGAVLASASEDDECLVIAEIMADRISANRASFFKLQGRRPEIYQRLSESVLGKI